jgi:hypothetical protein
MNYDPPISIVERLAPGAQTRAGVVWRLYWLWPELRCLYLAALVAWAFAAFVAPRYFEVPYDPAAGVFAPIELVAFIPLLYLGFLSGAPAGGFAPGCGRALAMLPVKGKHLRDAVWFVDVPSAPLMCVAACLLMALVIPLSTSYRLWFIIATLLAAVIYCGARATMSMGMLAYFRRRPNGLLERLAQQIEQLASTLIFVCIVAMMLGHELPLATWAAVAICAAVSALSFAHRPMMAGTRGDGGAGRKKGSAVYSSGRWEIARIYATPMLMTCAVMALFSLFLFYIDPTSYTVITYQTILTVSVNAGQHLATRVRTARLLPLSSRTLTIATLAVGISSALPLPIFFLAFNPAGLGDFWSVVALLCATIFIAAIATSSIWGTFYPPQFVAAGFAVLIAGGFIFYALFSSLDGPTSMKLAIPLLIFGPALFAVSAWSIDRKFWWDSKVYRHQFQQKQRQMDMGNLSASGEALYLVIALLAAVAGIFCGIVWLAGGGA